MTQQASSRDPFTGPASRFAFEKTANGFRVSDVRFGISAEAGELSEAYKQLLDARQEVVRAHQDAGQPIDLDSDPERAPRGRIAASAFLAAGVALGIVVQIVAQRVGAIAQRVEEINEAKTSGRAVALVVAKVADAADDMSEDREEQLRRDVRRIVSRAVPLVQEARPLIKAILEDAPPADAEDPFAPMSEPREGAP